MPHHTLAAARVAHRAHPSQIKFADELRSERRAASGVKGLQNIEMFLHQLRTSESAEIKHGVVDGVNSVSAD